MSPKKLPPVVPVVPAAGTGGGDNRREDELRRWEEEQAKRRQEEEQAAQVPAQAPLPAPAPTAVPAVQPPAKLHLKLPDPDSDPVDQLALCERSIHEAKARWKSKVDTATEEFLDVVGPYLCWVHENRLYKLMFDKAGKPYRSFARYLKDEHDLTERTGYRITQTLPLLRILRGVGFTLDDLSARQVEALHPVRLQYGDEAVARVWATACETKKALQPTPDELVKAKKILDLTTRRVSEEEDRRIGAGTDAGVVLKRAETLLVPDTVREAVKQDPERVRMLYRVLGRALEEAGVERD